MLIENTQVFGFEAALRSMRNPMDSWKMSDSKINQWPGDMDFNFPEQFAIGSKDSSLLAKLTNNGTEHRKCLRLIQVWVTLTLPRYVWTEFDTYKVGCTRMSCSTMHKLGTRELTKNDFAGDIPDVYLYYLNGLGCDYRAGGKTDYDLVRKMKAALPEGYLQKADVNINYETAINIFRQRKNHRLSEWRFTGEANDKSICNWIYSLPYMKEILKAAGYVE